MKTAALILVWLICLANSLFFFDIIYWYLVGAETSPNTKANCGEFQAIFSLVMLFIIAAVLCVYTHVLLKHTR
jgi:hypothetical protein